MDGASKGRWLGKEGARRGSGYADEEGWEALAEADIAKTGGDGSGTDQTEEWGELTCACRTKHVGRGAFSLIP